ncbi:MAG: hypothetical protein C4326_05385 [Ignavibacteria bacterium]
MFRFGNPEYLILLALAPLLVLVAFAAARARRKAWSRFGSLDILSRLAEDASRAKRLVKYSLLVAAYVCLVLAIANPQIGTRLVEVKQEGVDIFIALDVSLSMKAEDLKPNRLEKAKWEIRNLIDKLAGDRIGLVVFAGEAYTQFPLTTDYSGAKLFLDAVDVDAVPIPGTNIGAAIQRAMESFDFNEPTTKVLVILSDGENTEGDAFPAAEEAAAKGVRIYTIGLGSPSGAPIPLYNAAGQQVDFKRDKLGSIVITTLDEVALEKLAALGNGVYYRGSNTQDELNEIFKTINSLQKKEFGVKQFTDYDSRYQYVLAVGIFLLLIELMMSEKKVHWLARWNPLRAERSVEV